MLPMPLRKSTLLIVCGVILAGSSCSKSTPSGSTTNTQSANEQASSVTITTPQVSPSPNGPTDGVATKTLDACSLLTTKEIQSILGEPLKETKPSGMSQGGFDQAQCVFVLPTFVKSVSLTVTKQTAGRGGHAPREFWNEAFHSGRRSEPERERERENEPERGREMEREKEGSKKEEEAAAPEKITGVGDEAFWSPSRVGGALYVLKENAYIRISVGGGGDQETRIKKSKALAQLVLKRL